MQYEDSARFMFALVKRCRKYYLGITTITQDVNDFLRSPYGQAIVNNSSLQLLMKQSPSAVDLIQKTFDLTDGEKFLLLESGVGEGIFFAGQKHAAIKVVASYTEDQIVTTNPQQLLDIEQAKKDFEVQLSKERGEDSRTRPVAPGAKTSEPEASPLEEEPSLSEKAAADAAAALLSREDSGKAEADRIKSSLQS